ncbi:MAG: hypothetical protein CVU71_18340 [Deltaproteobacteria bacterium HGW-Deltaproteobacteria-6]|jgi:hypothetical protein|nr:MAG: hypothetical protein CVU71_18340 [Deltaproteobacteria bacterium HGW-Deltaproteobacteria-6]
MAEIILDESEDWDKRVLCSDESCIGTIGADGKCRECGKTYEGVLPQGHDKETAEPVIIEKTNPVSSEDFASDEEWDKRVLCSDGNCIGVIGPDGKCRECGKPLS